jgi:hypothetical protein
VEAVELLLVTAVVVWAFAVLVVVALCHAAAAGDRALAPRRRADRAPRFTRRPACDAPTVRRLGPRHHRPVI